jgi:hypothetical protein
MQNEHKKSSGISFSPDVWHHIEAIRGRVPRSVIIDDALRDYYDLGNQAHSVH